MFVPFEVNYDLDDSSQHSVVDLRRGSSTRLVFDFCNSLNQRFGVPLAVFRSSTNPRFTWFRRRSFKITLRFVDPLDLLIFL